MQEEIIATIPQESSDSMLEVALIQGSCDNPTIELRRLSWGGGVGWYRQHTLRLDYATAQALLQTLRQARGRLRKRDTKVPGKVISFPGSKKTEDRAEQGAV